MNVRPNRVLIVDDNEMNCDMLARRLERKGYVVDMAASARELMERVKKESPDLILLDIEMPEISGLEGLQKIREVYSPIELPVIMVTARNQSEDIVKALAMGANDYLTKPIDFAVALARIGTQLSHKRAQEGLKESEERYALAAQGANDGLWDWNLVTNEIYFSPRWKAMIGYLDDELAGNPEEWFERIHHADQERTKEELSAHKNGMTPHFESVHRVRHKDGTFRWMLSRGLAIRDRQGKPLRMAGSQTDITEGKVSDPLTGLPNRLLFPRPPRSLDEARDAAQGSLVCRTLPGPRRLQDDQRLAGSPHRRSTLAGRLEASRKVPARQLDTTSPASGQDTFTLARMGGDEVHRAT